ncbi:MAG: metal ABC transporter substrate-binding protein [Candidatus Eremiobacterota bacterium]
MKKLTLLCIFLLIFSGCKKQQEKKEVLIMTSFYPVYISTINVTRDIPGIKVLNLTEPQTGCIHNYALTVDNMKNLSLSDIFIINGAGMENFLDRVIRERSNLKIIDTSKDIVLIEENYNNKSYNPHIWVSISNLIKQVENIEKGLSMYDPSNKEYYEKNAELYIEKLRKLKYEMEEGMKDIKCRNIVTFHKAFDYFAKEFNLNIVAVIENNPGTEPNAKEMAETIKIIRDKHVKVLFAEPQYSSSSAHAIAKETGLNVSILDPAVTGPMEENAYINIMRSNLDTLRKTLN